MPEDADQITLNTAGDHVDSELMDLLSKSYPQAQFTTQMIKELKERHSTVAEVQAPIQAILPVDGKPTEFDVTEAVRGACSSIVDPIVDGLGKLVASFDPEFQDRLKGRVLLAGGGVRSRGWTWPSRSE